MYNAWLREYYPVISRYHYYCTRTRTRKRDTLGRTVCGPYSYSYMQFLRLKSKRNVCHCICI